MQASAPSPAAPSIARLHALLSAQTLVILLGSANRLGPWTLGYVAPNEFLRWVDLINMLPLPLLSVCIAYLLTRELARLAAPPRPPHAELPLMLLLIVAVYLLGAGYGDHEVTNYFHARFCADGGSAPLCRLIIFHDDEFSHWLFFAGFTLLNLVLVVFQALFRYGHPLPASDQALLIINGLVIALGIFANLAFEELGLDLYVVALITTVVVALRVRHGPQPLLIYYNVAYLVGLGLTVFYRAAL